MRDGAPPVRFFCPGPVWVPERIRNAIAEPILHHRTAAFRAIMTEVREQLRRLWGADGWEPLVFACTGTGMMDGAVANFMRRGAKALVVSAGKFGERWGHALRAYGCEVIDMTLPWGGLVDVDATVNLLRAHPDIRAVYLTSADTSAGVEHDLKTLGPALRAHTDALIVIDAICDFGGPRHLRPQAWGADIAVSCSQKCLMLPPGLGIATVAPRAWEFYASSDLPRFYLDWRKEYDRERRDDLTAFTASVALTRGLCESLRMLEEEGMDHVVARYARVGDAVRQAVRALGLDLLAARPSNALTAVRCPGAGDRFVAHMYERYGYRIARGQDAFRGEMFRLGHMGQLTREDILGLIEAVARTAADLELSGVGAEEALAVAAKAL